MPEPADAVSNVAQTVTQTGLTSVGLFALLVALTRWIGGNFTKEVTDLKTTIETMKKDNKAEMLEIKKAREDCEAKHENTAKILSDTKCELSELKGRLTALDGKQMFEVRSDDGEMHDKN